MKECYTNYFFASIKTRALGVTPEGLSAIRTYVALQFVGTLVELIRMVRMKREKWPSQYDIIMHHIITMMGSVVTLYNHRGMPSACALKLVEVTTIFLNFLLFSKNPAYKTWVQKHMPWLAPLSGTALWCVFEYGLRDPVVLGGMRDESILFNTFGPFVLIVLLFTHLISRKLRRMSFILFRLLLPVFIMWRWIKDFTSGDPVLNDFSNFEMYYLWGCALFVWVMSCYWFKKIHKGFMKEIRKLFQEDSKGNKKKTG